MINVIVNDIQLIEVPAKKQAIPAAIRDEVWNTCIPNPDLGKGNCYCCGTTIERFASRSAAFSYNCGHIIAEANGGPMIAKNMKPICRKCNSEMGTKPMYQFEKLDEKKVIELKEIAESLLPSRSSLETEYKAKIHLKSLVDAATAHALTGNESCLSAFAGTAALYHGEAMIKIMANHCKIIYNPAKLAGSKFLTYARDLLRLMWGTRPVKFLREDKIRELKKMVPPPTCQARHNAVIDDLQVDLYKQVLSQHERWYEAYDTHFGECAVCSAFVTAHTHKVGTICGYYAPTCFKCADLKVATGMQIMHLGNGKLPSYIPQLVVDKVTTMAALEQHYHAKLFIIASEDKDRHIELLIAKLATLPPIELAQIAKSVDIVSTADAAATAKNIINSPIGQYILKK